MNSSCLYTPANVGDYFRNRTYIHIYISTYIHCTKYKVKILLFNSISQEVVKFLFFDFQSEFSNSI